MDTISQCSGSKRSQFDYSLKSAALHMLVWVFETVAIWHERAVQRRQLGELDDRMLRDIGIGRADAERESGKRFWQA